MSQLPSAPNDQTLPTKEAGLFRQIVKFYELKQYKKAVKTADQVLKKFSNHGETLSMKGLALSSLDKKEEAYDLARKGLKADLRSHVCWHVYGLLYRADQNYREAIKCYLQALRLDKENMQILRDLSLLQIQTRDMAGFLDTRYQLLQIRANNRTNWLGFAVAHHLSNNFDLAVQVLEAYDSTVDEIPDSEAYEHSELLLYKAMVLQEGGRAQEALHLLVQSQGRILDKAGVMEAKAGLLSTLGMTADAEAVYRQLLASNPDNQRIHEGLQRCLGLRPADSAAMLSDAQRASAAALYRDLGAQYPRSGTCARILLDFLDGEEFTAQAEWFVRPYLVKGIPSLFSALKPLYKSSDKAAQLGRLFTAYRATLEAGGSLPPLEAYTGAQSAPASGDSALVWVLAFLGQHHSELHDTAAALECLDAASSLDSSLDVVELHTFRSKVLRRAGDFQGAAVAAEAARKMDLADRFLNSLAVRALFEAGTIEEAERTAALFTRDTEKQGAGLKEMQHMWYEVHCGRAHMAAGTWGKALEQLQSVGKHFEDIREDQFDFHSYCLRKLTLRSYIHLLRMQDSLYSHPSYSKAALAAVDCWLLLESKKEAAAAAGAASENGTKAAAAKKVEQQRQRLEAAKLAGGQKKKPSAKEESDAAAAALLATADPLGEAVKLVAMLKEHAGGQGATHVAAFQVALQRGRLLMALSAAQRAQAAGGLSCPDAHRCTVRLALAASKEEAANEVVKRLMGEGMEGLLGGRSVEEFTAAFLAQHGRQSLAHAAAAAEMQVAVEPSSKEAAVKLLMEVPPEPSKQGLRQAVAVHRMLLERLQHAEGAAEFKQLCSKVFRWSTYFAGEQAGSAEESSPK